jgi:hypothetical protein
MNRIQTTTHALLTLGRCRSARLPNKRARTSKKAMICFEPTHSADIRSKQVAHFDGKKGKLALSRLLPKFNRDRLILSMRTARCI